MCGDGEYIIYTALAWRNKSFGSALDFVWASKENSNDFAIRESPTSVKVYKNFNEKSGGLDVGFQAEGLTGGVLLGVKGQGGVSFFDWATGGLVRTVRMEAEPRQVSCGVLQACNMVRMSSDTETGLLVRERRARCHCLRRHLLHLEILAGELHRCCPGGRSRGRRRRVGF